MTTRSRRDEFFSVRHTPLFISPMAGGPSTPVLVIAGIRSGAFAFLAGGYKSALAMSHEIAAVRAATNESFGVNLFVPGAPTRANNELDHYLETLAGDATSLETALGVASWDDDEWSEKIEALVASPVDVVSFTFGCPSNDIVNQLHRAGSLVVITVTSDEEARLAEASGADILCAQGSEAGAHRGTFDAGGSVSDEGDVVSLVRSVTHTSELPTIAAGGIMSAADVQTVLAAGAVGAQCGTAFLRCPESGAHPLYKAALADERFTHTDVTRSFSGRNARGLVNQFMIDHPVAPWAYPEVNNATRPLRGAAARRGDVDRMSLWAGTGFKQALAEPVARVVETLTST